MTLEDRSALDELVDEGCSFNPGVPLNANGANGDGVENEGRYP
jgi:hypothetical protein